MPTCQPTLLTLTRTPRWRNERASVEWLDLPLVMGTCIRSGRLYCYYLSGSVRIGLCLHLFSRDRCANENLPKCCRTWRLAHLTLDGMKCSDASRWRQPNVVE